MPLINAYGLSETSGGATLQEFPNYKLDKAGKPLPGSEIKIYNPDENGIGEICIRGRNVFMGYLKNEGDTIEVLDSDRFFHTGDIGFLDNDGFLEITGRLKEIIITAGGENISPLPIEQRLKEVCPLISNCVIIGDEMKYLICLFTLKVKTD